MSNSKNVSQSRAIPPTSPVIIVNFARIVVVVVQRANAMDIWLSADTVEVLTGFLACRAKALGNDGFSQNANPVRALVSSIADDAKSARARSVFLVQLAKV